MRNRVPEWTRLAEGGGMFNRPTQYGVFERYKALPIGGAGEIEIKSEADSMAAATSAGSSSAR
jgi:hypothetical protein